MSFTIKSGVVQQFDLDVIEISVLPEGESFYSLGLAADMQSAATSGSGAHTDTGTGEMAMSVAGDATGLGENTLAAAQVHANLTGGEGLQIANASAEFAAVGSGDAGAYAVAYSQVSFAGDVDRIVTLNQSVNELIQEPDSSYGYSSASSTLFAVNIGENPIGNAAADGNEAPSTSEPPPAPSWEFPSPGDLDNVTTFDGNVAWFDISADAVAENSSAIVEFSALTIEDQLSTATVYLSLGIS